MPLTLRASEHQVRIFDGDALVAEHGRSYDRRQVIEVPAHIDALVAEKRRASELRGRDRLRSLCSHADAVLDDLARRGEPLRQRTGTLNRLLERYGAAALDGAMADALSKGAPSVGSIAYLLDQERRRADREVPLAVPVPEHIRAKDVVVVPHDLGDYDQLSQGGRDGEDEQEEEAP